VHGKSSTALPMSVRKNRVKVKKNKDESSCRTGKKATVRFPSLTTDKYGRKATVVEKLEWGRGMRIGHVHISKTPRQGNSTKVGLNCVMSAKKDRGQALADLSV